MRIAADALTGFGDFRSFTDDDPEEKSTQVLLSALTLTDEPPLIIVRVTGSHFLWKMVRRLVGVLVEVGRGGLTPADMTRLLTSHSDLPPKLTAPASGLFLESVDY
jgi:tRNA pseudouridine38-40 synthase